MQINFGLLFHEISHIIYDEKQEFTYIDCDAEKEKLMDQMAANLLIPNESYNEFLSNSNLTSLMDINRFARKIGIHPCILVGRLKYDGHIPYTIFTNLSPKLTIVSNRNNAE